MLAQTTDAPVEDYLRRIGIDGHPQPTDRTLRTLQRAHLLNVPYDNLDAYLTPVGTKDPCTVVDRIVRRRRGGTSSELNVAFAVLLHALGYPIRLVQVQAPNPRADDMAPHLAINVSTESGRYLVDVSGGLSDEPLSMDTDACQLDTAGSFAVSTSNTTGTDVARRGACRHYEVTDPPPELTGWDDGWRAAPSGQTLKPLVSIRRARGRTTLHGTLLLESVGEAQTSIRLKPSAIPDVLLTRFNMRLERAELQQLVSS